MFRDRRTTRHGLLLAAAVLLSTSGCTLVTNTAMMPRQFDDSARLAPGYRPRSAVPVPNGNVLDQPQTEGGVAGTTPDPIPKIGRDADEGAGPSLIPGGPSAPARIEMSIGLPERIQVGSGATFQITLHNRSDRPLQNVVIEVDFDDAFVFPGRPEKRIRRMLGVMQAGESREVAVMLTSDTPGSHCARFTVRVAGAEVAWKEVCVTYVDRDLEVGVLGPRDRTVGDRAEFTVKLYNRSARELADLRVAVTFDDALEPRESSTGAQLERRDLRWELGALKPGEAVWLQVEFECVAAAESACVSVDVSSGNVSLERVSRCVRVSAAHGLLGLEVRDTRDPVTVGETTEHLIKLHNRSPQPLHGIRLTVAVPENLRVVSTDVAQEDRELEVEAVVEGGQVTFAPLATIPAGASVTYRLQCKAVRAGDAALTVRVEGNPRSPLGRDPVVTSEPLSVIAE